MNLLADIEGRATEQLASAMLRYLASGSHELQGALIRCLSRHFGRLDWGHHFATYLELPTKAEIPGPGEVNGYLDVLVEADNALIGIEVKVWAAFQEYQPAKYIPTLLDRSINLAGLRSLSAYNTFLAVLVPEARLGETEKHLREQGSLIPTEVECRVVTWEELFAEFASAEHVAPHMAFLAHQLSDYIAEQLRSLDTFPRLATHLYRWEPRGSASQREVLGGLWHLIPDGGGRLGTSESWCGYGFGTGSDYWGWFGFVSSTQLEEPSVPQQAALIIATDLAIPAWESDKHFERKTLSKQHWPDKVAAWVVRFNEKWTTSDWRKHLEPLQRAIDAATGEQ